MRVQFYDDASVLLSVAGDALMADGARSETQLTMLRLLETEPDATWAANARLAVAVDFRGLRAVLTQTGNHPMWITGFGEVDNFDFVALAPDLGSEWFAAGINGPADWSKAFAAHAAEFMEREPTMTVGTRYFWLRELQDPRPGPGSMRAATIADRETALAYTREFEQEALAHEEQRDLTPVVEQLIAAGDLVFWTVDGVPSACAAVNRRGLHSSNIGLVYTPPDERGQGYASRLVAALTRRELDAGAEWVSLFTDLTNPTANHIYTELGFEPQADFALWHFGPRPG